MKKVLFVATIYKHFLRFHIPYIKWLKEQGYIVHCAANGLEGIPFVEKLYVIDIQRSPFSIKNIKAYKDLKTVIDNEQYDLVYCHTAMGAVIARLSTRKSRLRGKTKVLYMTHGFHFFKGSPVKYWIMYYPIEKFLSRYTDGIITINHEDFEIVKSHQFKNKKSYLINGIGVNTERLALANEEQRKWLRNKNGLNEADFVLIYIAEFIHRKNHRFIIDSIPQMIKSIPNLKILFAGRGGLLKQLQQQVFQLNIDSYVFFLGFRNDIGELIALSDIGISASRQEGLGLNIAEEMFCGLPVVATIDRGHKEMIVDGVNGFLFPQNSTVDFIDKILYLYLNPAKRLEMGKEAYNSIQKFCLENSLKSMSEIFNDMLK